MRTRVPSVVVIQERHVRYGEKFKVLKVSGKSKREYVAKFLSPRKFTFRCKSKQVVIGRRTKELRYKGSPMAISRLLLLDGLGEPFPQFAQMKKSDWIGLEKRETDSDSSPTSINPPLSFFNLSDTRAIRKTKGASAELSAGTASMLNLCRQMDVTCSPQSLCDFHLLFGSDTTESEDESDVGDTETVTVEVDDKLFSSQNKNDETEQNALNKTIKKIEKDVNQIASNIKSAFEAAAQKVTVTFPHQTGSTTLTQPLQNNECNGSTVRNQLNYGNNQRNQRNNNHASLISCPHIQPSGSVPFFRVPGGCILVVQGTNQTTPVLYGTFMTGDTYQQQYQQVQLPIYGMHQVISIHIGHYRLSRDEVNRIFNFVSNCSNSLNPGRF